MPSSPTLAVIGSLTIDEVFSKGQLRIAQGGSALYVSTTSAALGSEVDIISRVGMDYPSENLAWLERKGVRTRRIARFRGKTCRFGLHYRGGFRTLHVIHPGLKLSSKGLNRRWGAIHIGSVFQEVPPYLIPICKRHSSFVSMDLQGFVRQRGAGSKVVLKPARLGKAMPYVDVLKATIEEALVQTRSSDLASAISRILRQGPKYLIVTLGERGSVFAERNGRVLRIPAYPEKTMVDPTGAGDAMIGGWLSSFLSTKDPVWAASVGTGLASLLVRSRGLSKFQWSKEELFRRSAWVYTRVKPARQLQNLLDQ